MQLQSDIGLSNSSPNSSPCRNVDLKTLKHEAEFFGLLPLGMTAPIATPPFTVFLSAVKRLAVCDELEKSNCGSLLFYCQISPPVFESLPPNFGICNQHPSKTGIWTTSPPFPGLSHPVPNASTDSLIGPSCMNCVQCIFLSMPRLIVCTHMPGLKKCISLH